MKPTLLIQSLAGILILAFVGWYISSSLMNESTTKTTYTPTIITWYDTEIEVSFTDGSTRIFNLVVYDNLDNIHVVNGNLSYLKPNADSTDGILATKVELASFVKSYVLRKSELRSGAEYEIP